MSDYKLPHRPATASNGAPLHDLTKNDVYPKDVYETLRHYRAGDPSDVEAETTVKRVRGRPNDPVTIYRALPKEAPPVIHPGDWVAIAREYARAHSRHPYDATQDMQVVWASARAQDLHTSGDSLQEWGYNGKAPLKGRTTFRKRKAPP